MGMWTFKVFGKKKTKGKGSSLKGLGVRKASQTRKRKVKWL